MRKLQESLRARYPDVRYDSSHIMDFASAEGRLNFQARPARSAAGEALTVAQARLMRTIAGASRFLVSVIGTSVTAGHDNYWNESYPVVAHLLLSEALRPLGVKVRAHRDARRTHVPRRGVPSAVRNRQPGDGQQSRGAGHALCRVAHGCMLCFSLR